MNGINVLRGGRLIVAAFLARLSPRLDRSESGSSAVEYGLLLALIAVAIVGAVAFLGTQISSTFSCSSQQIGDPSAPPC